MTASITGRPVLHRAGSEVRLRSARRSRCTVLRPSAMRAVVQRVKSASVTVDGQEISRIGSGLLCLIGIRAEDSPKDADFISRRILNSRLFENKTTARSWDQSVVQQGLEVLCVSQFTLFNIMKGNKPDFHLAMPPSQGPVTIILDSETPKA